MKKLYRVLVIDDDKGTIDRIANLINPLNFSSNSDVWEIETKALHVEVIEKPKAKGHYEISDHCIESLVKISDKKFDLVIADFGYSQDSSIYDKLPLNDKGEISLQDLKDKVFTPEDLIVKAKQYAKINCTGKKKSNLEENFFWFDGKLVVYSYQDKRFNRAYHTIGERATITKNVFPRASFDGIHDIKLELFDTNEQHKSDNDFYAFLKCKFINGIIQNKLKEAIISSLENSTALKKVAKNSNEKAVSVLEFYKENKKETNRSILTFLLPLIIAAIAISCKEWISNRSPLINSINFQDYFLSVFVLASIVIMLIGTGGFYSDSKKLLTDYKQDNNSVKTLFGKSLNGTVVTIVFGWIFFVASIIVIIASPSYISLMLLSFECISTFVFGIFLFIDYWLMKGAKIARDDSDISQKDKNHFSRAYSFSRDSILFIDSPVLLASLIIFLTSLYFEINSTVVDESTMFHHGFSTGALVVHIIFSQYIFMMLKIKDSYIAFNETTKRN